MTHPFRHIVVFSAFVGMILASSLALAQRGTFGRGGADTATKLYLLSNEDVVKELELVDDQQEKLAAMRQRTQEEAREMFSGLRDLSADERREKFEEFRTKMADRQKEIDKEIDGILLSHQKSRLAQIQTQMQLRRQGGGSALSSDRLVEELGITDAQKEQLQKVQEEVRNEMRDQIRKLQADAQKKVLDVLSPEQRKKYEEMVGEPFSIQSTRSFGGRDGQRGRFGRRPQGNRPESDDN